MRVHMFTFYVIASNKLILLACLLVHRENFHLVIEAQTLAFQSNDEQFDIRAISEKLNKTLISVMDKPFNSVACFYLR